MAKKRQRAQKEFFDVQEELLGFSPPASKESKREAVALDWSEQGIVIATGVSVKNISTLIKPDGLSTGEIESLRLHEIYITRESLRNKQLEWMRGIAHLVPRVLAVYYSFIPQLGEEPCIVISIGLERACGALITNYQVKREQESYAELSLGSIWRKYLEANGPFRKVLESMQAKQPDVAGKVFDGFASALREGKAFEYSRLQLRPPMDLKSSLASIIALCKSVDPHGEARNIILSDWAATHSNLGGLLKPYYPKVLKPAPVDAFKLAAIGLVSYSLEKKRYEESRRKSFIKKLLQRCEELDERSELLRIAVLTKTIIDNLKNISTDSVTSGKVLSSYLQTATQAHEVKEYFKKALDSKTEFSEDAQALEMKLVALEESIERLKGIHNAKLFVHTIDAASHHSSLKEQNAELKQLLGIEEIVIPVGTVIQPEDLPRLHIINVIGSGAESVITELIEPGYKLRKNDEVIKQAKVGVRLQRPQPTVQTRKPRQSSPARKRTNYKKSEESLKTGGAGDASSSKALPIADASVTRARADEPPIAIQKATQPASKGLSISGWAILSGLIAGILLLSVALFALRRLPPSNSSYDPSVTDSSTNGPDQSARNSSEQTSSNNSSVTPNNMNVDGNLNANIASQGVGTLNISSNIDGVQVWVDSRAVYLNTPFQGSLIELPSGVHYIKAVKAGYPPWTRTINLGAGDKLPVFIAFNGSPSDTLMQEPTPAPYFSSQPSTQERAVIHLNRATQLYYERNYDEALAEANQGLSLDPGNQSLQRLKANIESARRTTSQINSTPTATSDRPHSVAQPSQESGSVVRNISFEPAVIKSRVIPSYPVIARSTQMAGTVVVEVTINESGNVISAKAIQGPMMFRQVSESAALKWKYKPAIRDGRPIISSATIVFNFKP